MPTYTNHEQQSVYVTDIDGNLVLLAEGESVEVPEGVYPVGAVTESKHSLKKADKEKE